MYTDKQREELLENWKHLVFEVFNTLQDHKVLPASITRNLEETGITIEFRKVRKEQETDYSGEDHQGKWIRKKKLES